MKTQRSYASGFVDALALVCVTLLVLIAALFAGGCAARRAEPPAIPASSSGCEWTVIDVRVVDLVDDEPQVQP